MCKSFLCECGAVALPSYIYFNCPLKGHWHVKKFAIPRKKLLQNILHKHLLFYRIYFYLFSDFFLLSFYRNLLKMYLFSERSIKLYLVVAQYGSFSQSLPPVVLWVLSWQSCPIGNLVCDYSL